MHRIVLNRKVTKSLRKFGYVKTQRRKAYQQEKMVFPELLQKGKKKHNRKCL